MALTLVCSNCGWSRRVYRRPDAQHRLCPRCTSVLNVVEEHGSWALYFVIATVAVVLVAAALVGCLFVGLLMLRAMRM